MVRKRTVTRSQEFAESLINTVREPLIALDQDLRVVSVSRSFYEFFKVKPEETVGQLIYNLGNKQWDIPKLRELLETILPEKTSFDNYEVEHDFTTIGKRTMLLNARQIERAMGKERIILLAIEDITERRQLEDLLEESEERFRRIFETADDGIVLLEKREGHIVHANPATVKMLGYSEAEYIGKMLQDIGVPINMSDFPAIMESLNKRGILNYDDVPVKTKSGQNIYADIYMVNRAKLAQCNIRDITERKQAEEILRTYNRLLEILAGKDDIILMLEELVSELKHFTGCAALGIRLLDEDGNIPYQAYDGFSRAFYELESPLSIKSDKCMCINVIKGMFYSKLSFYTEGGSFYMNGTTNFLASVSQEEKGEMRNACNEAGYESVALVPICLDGQIVGLFHVADPKKNMVPLYMVELLERFGRELGSAILRIRFQEALKDREQELRHKSKRLEEVNTALNVMLIKRDEDKLMMEERVLFNVKELIDPLMENLKNTGLDENQAGYVNTLENFLAEIVSPFSQTLHTKYLKLTLSEIRVANLVKEGKTTKEIARLLNSNPNAIGFHRQNLRKKLGLTKHKASLASHLLSLLK